MPDDLVPVAFMEAPQIRLVALHVGEIIDDVLPLRGGVDCQLPLEGFALVEVIAPDQFSNVRLQHDLRLPALKLFRCGVHPVERIIQIPRQQGADVSTSAFHGRKPLQDLLFSVFHTGDLTDRSGVYRQSFRGCSQTIAQKILVLLRSHQREQAAARTQVLLQGVDFLLIVVHEKRSPAQV